MTSVEDILNKSQKFKPQKYRSWDYISEAPESGNISSNKSKKSSNKHEKSSNKLPVSGNISGNKFCLIRGESGNICSNKNEIIKKLIKTKGNEKICFSLIVTHIRELGYLDNIIELSISALSIQSGISQGIIRTTINRMIKKGFFIRLAGKMGRHGCLKLSIPNFILRESFTLFDTTNPVMPKSSNKKTYSSISNININTTTTKTTELDINNANELPENWTEINIEPLADVGFSISHLKQLCKKSLNTPDVVQESIHHFAYSLKHNDRAKAYSHPLNVLMGVLRKGEAWVESRYESPQLIAQRSMLKRKAAEQEKMKKLREAAFNLAFEAWQDSLSDEAQTTLLKETKQGKHDIRPEKIRLIKYFTETIWPDKKSEYLTDPTT